MSMARLDTGPKPNHFYFTFRANRFLRGMVRILVAQLLEVISGRLDPEEFLAALHQQKDFTYFRSAYPQGLYLTDIEYPDHIDLVKNNEQKNEN